MPELRALIIEDSVDDVELLVREMSRKGYELRYERVDTAYDMEARIGAQPWDIIFSDWNMPRFSAPDALAIVQRHGIDVPFIIISGRKGEEAAVTALRSGAHDYFLKDNLALLVPAVERELRETAIRRERTDIREQLLVADRMASIGILAAGVAHEINNPLSAVIGNLDLALRSLDRLEAYSGDASALADLGEEVRVAHEAAAKIRQVANDLRLFSRADGEDRNRVDVQSVMESSLRMAQNEIRHRARLRTNFSPVPMVVASGSRLGQVFLNLIINATQSIPDGQAEENEISISTKQLPDGEVVVEVRDTGSGMPAEIKKAMFEPFFTTRPVGVGTGLGLAICERIISSLGGSITVESEIGRGTAIQVHLLPALQPVEAAGRSDEEAGPPPAIAPEPVRRGSVLVIDDEVAIGILIQRVLEDSHDVTRTTSARQALQWISDGHAFDVILCDLMMPDMNGMDFHNELTRVDGPQADRVIFATGGAFTVEARKFMIDVANERIEKPFDIGELAAIVDAKVAKMGSGLEGPPADASSQI